MVFYGSLYQQENHNVQWMVRMCLLETGEEGNIGVSDLAGQLGVDFFIYFTFTDLVIFCFNC